MLSSMSSVAVANGACCRRTSRLSDGLRLLSKLAVVGDMGTATRQTGRGCAGSPWPQSGAERWNYRQSDGEDDRKRGIRGYDGGSAPWVASATSSWTFWACFSLWWFILPGSKIVMEPNMFSRG